MKRIIPYTVIAAFAALFLCSCVKEQGGKGMLSVVLEWNLDAEVEQLPAVKAVYEADDAFRVSISPGVFDGIYSELKGQTLLVTAGTYTVSAYNCTEQEAAEGYGKARYAGEQDVEVIALQDNPVSVVCRMTNSKVSLVDFTGVESDGTFAEAFDIASTVVTLSGSADMTERPLILYDGSIYSAPAYYSAGEELYVKVSTRRKGAENAFEYIAGPFVPDAATWVKLHLSYDPSATTGGISFTSFDVVSNDWCTLQPYVSGTLKEDE